MRQSGFQDVDGRRHPEGTGSSPVATCDHCIAAPIAIEETA
ncbi:protein of unknown function [Burkholderia multivorans]